MNRGQEKKGIIVWTICVFQKEYHAYAIKTSDTGAIDTGDRMYGSLKSIQDKMKEMKLTRFPPLENDHFSVVEMWM